MSSLNQRILDLITSMGTDSKQFRIWITGSSTGDLTGLTTTAKTSLVAAINEVKAAATGAPPSATELVAGIAEVATQTETDTGTDDARMVTPLKFATRMAAYAQPLSTNLTNLAGQASTAYGRGLLNLANQAALVGLLPTATDTTVGADRHATQAEVNAGTNDATIVTPLKFQTRLAAFAQPLNANLTNLAAVAGQTSYGQALLTLANQAALLALFPATSDTVSSIQRNATQAEVNAGTVDTAQVTPLKLQSRLTGYAVPLTYIDTDVALAANSDVKLASQKAVKAYADALLDANNAWVYKGVIDASLNPNYPAASAGHTYKISVAGKIGGASGINVEVGDTITCLVDGTAAGNQATVGANWIVQQTNIDGAVVGPASSTAGDLATFSGTTGKVVQDSGVAVSTDGTFAANSNAKLPTEQAVKTYAAATYYDKTALGNPDTDLAAAYAAAKA